MNTTKHRAKMIYGQEMKPCPKCGSWNFRPQTPIITDIKPEDLKDVRKCIGKWAMAYRAGPAKLQGPCYFMCFDCWHKGPSVDCSGRTTEDVGQDVAVFTEMKRLWNEQERP